jgi:MraZ protein
VFLGEYQHSLDDKGRVVMPAKFRDGLSRGLVVTKGQERCLYVFPIDQWEEEMERITNLPRTDRSNRIYARSFFGAATDQQTDKQGRFQIPPALRTYAGLERDVIVVGVSDRIEIWDAQAWESMREEADSLYADIGEPLRGEGV